MKPSTFQVACCYSIFRDFAILGFMDGQVSLPSCKIFTAEKGGQICKPPKHISWFQTRIVKKTQRANIKCCKKNIIPLLVLHSHPTALKLFYQGDLQGLICIRKDGPACCALAGQVDGTMSYHVLIYINDPLLNSPNLRMAIIAKKNGLTSSLECKTLTDFWWVVLKSWREV